MPTITSGGSRIRETTMQHRGLCVSFVSLRFPLAICGMKYRNGDNSLPSGKVKVFVSACGEVTCGCGSGRGRFVDTFTEGSLDYIGFARTVPACAVPR